jgi:hypothetical protein
VNAQAKQARDGLFALDVRFSPRSGRFFFRFRAYGDLVDATEALMTLQWRAGDESYVNQSTWKAVGNGWKLELPGE